MSVFPDFVFLFRNFGFPPHGADEPVVEAAAGVFGFAGIGVPLPDVCCVFFESEADFAAVVVCGGEDEEAAEGGGVAAKPCAVAGVVVSCNRVPGFFDAAAAAVVFDGEDAAAAEEEAVGVVCVKPAQGLGDGEGKLFFRCVKGGGGGAGEGFDDEVGEGGEAVKLFGGYAVSFRGGVVSDGLFAFGAVPNLRGCGRSGFEAV